MASARLCNPALRRTDKSRQTVDHNRARHDALHHELEEAVELVVFAFEHAANGDIMVQKAPACTIAVLAEAVKELFNPQAETKIIGIRHGEKMYETLLTKEECAHAEDMATSSASPATNAT